MNRRIVFLVNPKSGTGKKDSILQLINNITKQYNTPYEIIYTNAAGNYLFLKEKIAKEKITEVVLVGGDGTVNHALAALYNEPITFGIIPVGSGNGLARAANIPMKPKEAIELIFKGGKVFKTDAFLINNHFSCMLSGVGFDAKVAHDFSKKTARGLLTYTTQSLINFFKAHPYQFEVTIDNFTFFTEAFFISVANSNQFGNNVTIAPKASLNDGLLDVVIVQKMNKAALPFAVLKQIRGNNRLQQIVDEVRHKHVLYFQTPALTIKNLKHAPFHVDGEPTDTADIFNIKVVKDCFNLIQRDIK
jgi:YegS/Rv2252/BmrU family lipid kinase